MNHEAARHEVREFMSKLETEPDHVLHVARLALQLFDSAAGWHQLDSRDRLLLESAACLHDIGWRTAPQGRAHHKESARLIRERAWQHFTREEVELIAQIARYHRKKIPGLEHDQFGQLSGPDQVRVQKLSALLRIADGLDRRHEQAVTQAALEFGQNSVRVKLAASDPALREISAAQKKSDLARALFGREISFELDRIVDS